MEMKEKEQVEQGNSSSIYKYLEKIHKEFTVWKESGDNKRSFLVITCEEDGTVNDEGFNGAITEGFISGDTNLLISSIYNLMINNKNFEKVIMKASGKFAMKHLKKMVNDIKNNQ